MDAQQLASAVFSAVDAMRPEDFGSHLTEDCTFVFGNWPAAEGRQAAVGAVSDFFAGIDGISHDIQDVWREGDAVVVRLGVTYLRKDGQKLTLPCANIWKIAGDKISDYRIYMDVNPVFA